jgi:hypothetical protein
MSRSTSRHSYQAITKFTVSTQKQKVENNKNVIYKNRANSTSIERLLTHLINQSPSKRTQ